jgi:ABC-2 type transport system ATP-binding protein
MDETRTILITTHQVEEIENLLTDVMFIDKGKIVLDASLETIADRYAAIVVGPAQADAARALRPIFERRTLGKTVFYYDHVERPKLAEFGEVFTPSVSDLFVATMSGAAQ